MSNQTPKRQICINCEVPMKHVGAGYMCPECGWRFIPQPERRCLTCSAYLESVKTSDGEIVAYRCPNGHGEWIPNDDAAGECCALCGTLLDDLRVCPLCKTDYAALEPEPPVQRHVNWLGLPVLGCHLPDRLTFSPLVTPGPIKRSGTRKNGRRRQEPQKRNQPLLPWLNNDYA